MVSSFRLRPRRGPILRVFQLGPLSGQSLCFSRNGLTNKVHPNSWAFPDNTQIESPRNLGTGRGQHWGGMACAMRRNLCGRECRFIQSGMVCSPEGITSDCIQTVREHPLAVHCTQHYVVSSLRNSRSRCARHTETGCVFPIYQTVRKALASDPTHQRQLNRGNMASLSRKWTGKICHEWRISGLATGVAISRGDKRRKFWGRMWYCHLPPELAGE